MRRSLIALATAALFALAPPVLASEPAAASTTTTTHGAPMPEGDAMPVTALLAHADQHSGHAMKFSGRITEVCQKTGCWVMLDAGGTGIRVRTKHDFFVPKDVSGSAVVYGTLEPVEVSEEQAKHYVDDGNAAAKPGREWQIIATSIVIES